MGNLDKRLGRLESLTAASGEIDSRALAWARLRAYFECFAGYGEDCPHALGGNGNASNHPYSGGDLIFGNGLVDAGIVSLGDLFGGQRGPMELTYLDLVKQAAAQRRERDYADMEVS